MSDRVVLVDDDRALLKATSQTLELAGFKVAAFTAAADALAGLDDGFPGVIVTDVRMPGMDGLDFFERIRAIDSEIPVVLVTGHGDIAMAVRAMRDGAYDFLTKPFAADMLVQSVRRAMEKRALVIENRQLRQAARSVEGDLPLIGQSRSIERLRDMLRQIADTNVDVLVRGETGSGKEVVATLLHRWSRRAKGNFVAVNCGALPEQIIESELFGHEPGAFTGAQKKRIGRIEHSSGGTLFLDEIESMPLDAQVRMLRVLEMRQVAPLGTNEIRPVDIRVVAAAKVDLGDPAQRSGFREDLYYRLNVVSLAIPPLRERREDIPLLFSHFADRAARRFDRDVPPLSPAVSRHLREYDFPGNVRELSHFAERFVLGVAEFDTGTESDTLGPAMGDPGTTLPARMEKYEEAILRETLEAYAGDVQQSIAALGIPRKTFYDKLQRHGIIRADYGGK